MNVSIDLWLKEAKMSKNADKVGMWLVHNGVVRASSKASVRDHKADKKSLKPVTGMKFSYNKAKLEEILRIGWQMDGIYYLKAELASGTLNVGDDIMYVLIGADTRPHAVMALEKIVGLIKETCVKEIEITEA